MTDTQRIIANLRAGERTLSKSDARRVIDLLSKDELITPTIRPSNSIVVLLAGLAAGIVFLAALASL